MVTISPLPTRARFGACVKCGSSSSKRNYFDLEVFIEAEGDLFLCVPCVAEMGQSVGFVTESNHRHVNETNQKLREGNQVLKDRIEAQSILLNSFAEERILREKENRASVEHARNLAIQETESRFV